MFENMVSPKWTILFNFPKNTYRNEEIRSVWGWKKPSTFMWYTSVRNSPPNVVWKCVGTHLGQMRHFHGKLVFFLRQNTIKGKTLRRRLFISSPRWLRRPLFFPVVLYVVEVENFQYERTNFSLSYF